MFATLFFSVFTVFLLMLPGFLLIRSKIIQIDTLKDLSKIIVKVFYPCLVFSSITTNFTFQKMVEAWQLPVAVFLILIIGYFVGLIFLGFFKTKDDAQRRAMLFQFSINNYSFLPIAIVAKLFSDEHVAALIFSTLGAEITLWTVGMFIVNPGEGLSLKNLKNLFSPPLWGIYISMFVLLLLHLNDTNLQEVIRQNMPLSYLYKTIQQTGLGTIPLAMLMTGGRMAKIKWSDIWQIEILYTTLFRLFIIPLVAVGVVSLLFAGHPFLPEMLIVAIMPSSIMSMIFAELYHADQKLTSGSVLVTHVMSLLSIPLWLIFLLD